MLLRDKTALVTGAGSGIGRAIALQYAREGANVVLSDIMEDTAKETLQMLLEATPDSRAFLLRTDASLPEDHERLVQAAIDRFGALHIACNNAGIGGELNPVADLSLEGWRKVVELNLSGVFYAMRAQIPRLLAAGGGSIVNVASILGQVATPRAAGYVAAKHGVIGLTQTAALEYAANRVRVNAIGPAYIDTPLIAGIRDEARIELVSLHPIGRLGRAEEVAELVTWLSSDRASFVTGSYYPIDGGYLAQ